MRENQIALLDNFWGVKTSVYQNRYQVEYSIRDIKELTASGVVFKGDNITIELFRELEGTDTYLRIMLDGIEYMLLEVPEMMARQFAVYLGFRLYAMLYILPNEHALEIMNDLRTDLLYQ